MEWEEELVLRNRILKFDKNFIYKLMIDISNKLQRYSKKYKVNLNICCIPGDYINIVGKFNIHIQFILNDKLLIIKLNNPNDVYIKIYIKDYYYYVEYNNLPSENNNFNREVYFLDKDLISNLLKDLLILNNKF